MPRSNWSSAELYKVYKELSKASREGTLQVKTADLKKTLRQLDSAAAELGVASACVDTKCSKGNVFKVEYNNSESISYKVKENGEIRKLRSSHQPSHSALPAPDEYVDSDTELPRAYKSSKHSERFNERVFRDVSREENKWELSRALGWLVFDHEEETPSNKLTVTDAHLMQGYDTEDTIVLTVADASDPASVRTRKKKYTLYAVCFSRTLFLDKKEMLSA